MDVIEIHDLSKDFPVGFWRKKRVRALDGLTLSVKEGEIFGFLGPNGAGKTTTLKLLMRLIYPTAGSAHILGRPIADISLHGAIGYLPEHPYFYDYLTAQEFLDYCAQLFGLDAGERRRRIARLLERVGLAGAADVQLRRFSKGMLQRAGIAQALVNDPRVVFLDEPLSGLDPVGRREVRDIILELREQGKTVFFSTHILSDVETMCDRVAILNKGRLHGLGRVEEFLGPQTVGTEVVVGKPSDGLRQSLAGVARKVIGVGDTLRVELGVDGDLYRIFEVVRQHGGQVLTVNPLRATLEDYFLQQFGTEKKLDLES